MAALTIASNCKKQPMGINADQGGSRRIKADQGGSRRMEHQCGSPIKTANWEKHYKRTNNRQKATG
jgi:hypothetical protein